MMRDLLRNHLPFKTVILLVVLVLSACASKHEYSGLVLDEPLPVTDIAGTDLTGEPFLLSNYAGEMSLVFFGYTYCPDVCPMTLAEVSRAYKMIEAESPRMVEDLNVVFVTVDPERDTPERLAVYVPLFHPTFHGVYIEPEQLEPIKSAYAVYAGRSEETKDRETDYLVDHTARVFLIDRQGNLQALFRHDTSAEELAADLKVLLKR
jgi:protein SCO1